MKPATSLNLFFDPSFRSPVEEQLRRVHTAGFGLIDINFWDWGNYPASPFSGGDWESWVERIRVWGEINGVRYHQAHSTVFNPFDLSPESLRKADSARRSIIGAGRLGIDWVVFHTANIADASEDERLSRNVEWLTPYVKLAEECGTGVALENMNDHGKGERYCCDACSLIKLCDAFSSPAVGLCWDVGHAHCQGIAQRENLALCADRLKVLHVQDNDGKTDGHTAPFYGTVDWNEVLLGLRDAGYKGEFTFEAHMLIRLAAESCRDSAARLLYDIGSELCGRFERLK